MAHRFSRDLSSLICRQRWGGDSWLFGFGVDSDGPIRLWSRTMRDLNIIILTRRHQVNKVNEGVLNAKPAIKPFTLLSTTNYVEPMDLPSPPLSSIFKTAFENKSGSTEQDDAQATIFSAQAPSVDIILHVHLHRCAGETPVWCIIFILSRLGHDHSAASEAGQSGEGYTTSCCGSLGGQPVDDWCVAMSRASAFSLVAHIRSTQIQWQPPSK